MQDTVEIGIILKAEPHGDFGICCHVLIPGGLRIGYASGALKPGAKLKSALQIFTIAEFTFSGKRIIGAHVLQLSLPIARDINRYLLACSVCEVLLSLKNTGEEIFHLSARTFESLTETTSAYKIFINFYTKLLVLLGYDIDIPGFKQIDNDKIDTVPLSLSTAKQQIKLLCECYKKYLDIKIPNSDIF